MHSQKIRVLHVDDEPDFAEMVGAFLEREDDRIDVRAATSVAEGTDVLAEYDVDVIVSDYDLSRQNGIEFLESVRARYPDLPFILYTGKGSEEIASEAISAGVTEYLQKETGTSQYAILANRVTNAVEQYRSRRAVEETERKLSEIADRTDDVLFMFGGDWSRLLFVNSAYEEMWGGSVAELESNPEAFLDRIHPEDRTIARRSMERLSSGEPDEVEYRVRGPDGDYRWVHAESEPIFDEDGNVARIVGFVRDVTARKERERELHRKERRYQAVFNDPNILVGLIDTDGVVLDINQTAMDYVDATTDSLAGTPFWETPWFDHSATVQREVKDWIDRAADGEYVEFEVDLERPDGEPYTIEGVFRPVTNDEGDVVSLLISDRDITDRKERERELERTTMVLSTLFEALPQGILAEDESRDVLTANQQLFTILGTSGSSEDIVGADCERIAREVSDAFAEPERFVERIDELTAEREPVDNEELALSDGRTLERTYRPIELPDGNGNLWVYRDVTDRKNHRRELERQNARLEEFNRVVSHDLRNPLNIAMGRLSMVMQEYEIDDLEEVSRAHDRMASLIEDLLVLAHEGERAGETEPVDLADVTVECWRNVDTAEADLVVETERTVEASRRGLQQLLENLVRNAVEHGGERVTVTVGDLADGFYVEDDGPGIPPEEHENVFVTGYSTNRKGTGFGLSIAQQVAETHDWRFELTDGSEGGARFEITGTDRQRDDS